jgi:glucose-1-phosphate thymidylyltransferase
MIREYVGAYYPSLQVEFIEQEERLGLGHAIYLSRETITDEPILIILGDTIFDVDLKRMVTSPFSELGVKYVEDPRRFGVAESSDGQITRLVEKPEHPKTNLAIVGLYYIKHPRLLIECLETMIADNRRTKGEFQLTDALQMMIDQGEHMNTFDVEGWFDCGKPETLLSTNQYLLERQPVTAPPPTVIIQPPAFIAPTAQVHNAIIGPNTTIAAGAVVNNAIICNAIVSEDATVENALIKDSIIGNHAVVRGHYVHINIGDSSELEYR